MRINVLFKANFSDKTFCEPLVRASLIKFHSMIKAYLISLIQLHKDLRTKPFSTGEIIKMISIKTQIFNKTGTALATRLNQIATWLLTSILQTY